MLLGLALGCLGLSGYDVWFTRRRIVKFGVAVELNPLLKYLAVFAGLDGAVFLACVVPTAILCAGGIATHSTIALAWFLGVKSCVAYFQRLSMRLEKLLENS